MKNILVTIDFHDKTGLLIERALEFAKAFNAKLWLLHVAAPEPDFVGYDVGPQYVRDFRAEELKEEHKSLLDYVEYLKKQHIEADGMVIPGVKIDTILTEAKKLNIDLIISGHHERGFFYEVFRGSVSSKIVSKSDIPVLVVPLEE